MSRDVLDEATRIALVGEANLAPSVHNIQPTRFRFEADGAITVLEDTRRRLTVGDPTGADNWKSVGAATEGLMMALTSRGMRSEVVWVEDASLPIARKARITVAGDAPPDRMRAVVQQRATWRGAFAKIDGAARKGLDGLRGKDDLLLVEDPAAVAAVAKLYDHTSLVTLRDNAYRAELRGWMRLSRFNLKWSRDGLNARAMAMSGIEAMGADVVLGKNGFGAFDRMGLAGPLIAEGAKVRSAAALGLFHRPADEHEFVTGRRFYRLWLDITAAGLSLCPMSVLADSADASARMKSQFGLGAERKLVTVFRIGRRPERARQPARARLSPRDLII